MTSVWLIYRMSRPMDVLREIRSSKESAKRRVQELLEQNPRADGFYCEEMKVLP